MTDSVYHDCPPRMSDGRFMRNFAPRCLQEFGLVDANQKPLTSYAYRQYLIHNGENIIRAQQAAAEEMYNCKKCDYTTQVAPQRVQTCDGRVCAMSPVDYKGVGLERGGA